MTLRRMLREVRGLRAEPPEANSEYDRALFDLAARCYGQRDVFTDDRADDLRSVVDCPRCAGEEDTDNCSSCTDALAS